MELVYNHGFHFRAGMTFWRPELQTFNVQLILSKVDGFSICEVEDE